MAPDERKYETVKLPAAITNLLHCNENVCINVCRRAKSDTNANPPMECDLMCLVKATEPQPWHWNLLRSYAISVKSHDKPESDYQVNLGAQLDRIGRQASHVAQVSFDASKGYVDSWKDGSQAAFFRRVYELSTDKDQLQVLRDHAKKTIDIFWNGDGKKKKKEKENEQDDKNDKDNKD